MTILHLQRTSAYNTHDFEQCVLAINAGDTLILIDDGCYNVTHKAFLAFKTEKPNIDVYHVNEHAHARAIAVNEAQSKPITMAQLVELTFKHDSTITWQ